ncbi:MAG: ribonuclease J [Hyphomicrobiaceae bacterium]|nr:ribonuclease J [Hyphomicrobiaceae bacterium]
MARRTQSQTVFIPLGGVGEIGMNLALYGYGPEDDRSYIMVDCGLSFAGTDLPGVDLLYPDVRFIEEDRHALKAIVITHAHEDHIGALAALWPRLKAPVFMSAFAHQLLLAKGTRDHGPFEAPVTLFSAGAAFDAGPFRITPVPVSHSIPEAFSLVIDAPGHRVLHTGDWKLDPEPVIGTPTDLDSFGKLADERAFDTMICDSTNAIRDGDSPSEGAVGRELTAVLREAKARVAVTLFSSNVARIRSVLKASEAAGRQVVVAGRALHRVIGVSRDLGYLADCAPVLDMDAFDKLPRKAVTLLMTGSQGEDRAALARISRDDHPMIALAPGDLVVFSSRVIPGNERGVIDIVNRLTEKGIEILTDRERPVHVSGHPRRGELVALYHAVKPKALIPVHGEAVHLAAQAALARENGIAETLIVSDGDVVRLDGPVPSIVDSVPSGILVGDGKVIDGPEETGVYQRRSLAERGIVSVALALDGRGAMLGDPSITLDGVPVSERLSQPLDEVIEDTIFDTLDSIPRARRKDSAVVSEAVRKAVRAAVGGVWGKRPACHVHVLIVQE